MTHHNPNTNPIIIEINNTDEDDDNDDDKEKVIRNIDQHKENINHDSKNNIILNDNSSNSSDVNN